MNIGENYRIESDSLNVTLYEKRITKKEHNVSWVAIGYYSRFGNALKALMDLGVKKTGLRDYGLVCKKQDELYKLIEGLKVSNKGVTE